MSSNLDRPDDFLERWKPVLREPVLPDPDRVAHLKAGIRNRGARRGHAQRTPIAPLRAIIAAAALVTVGFLAGRLSVRANVADSTVHRTAWSGPATRSVHFALVPGRADHVYVVGDFNDWDPTANPLEQQPNGVWSAEIPLPSGRHEYAYLVDGERWIADRAAPRSPEDEFGSANSVILVQAREP